MAARLTQIDYEREMALVLTERKPAGLADVFVPSSQFPALAAMLEMTKTDHREAVRRFAEQFQDQVDLAGSVPRAFRLVGK